MVSTDSNLSSPPSFSVLGLQVHLLDNYLDWLIRRLDRKIGTHVVTLNAEMSMMAQENRELMQTIEGAELVIPDGAGVIFYMRWRGYKHHRCPGIELAASLIESLDRSAKPHEICFFGGSPGTADKAAQTWQDKFPQLSILTQDGYVADASEAEWKQALQTKQPEVILVGIGVPRQELWIAQNRHLCPNSIWIGVGGSLDIWAGNKERAPEFLRNHNLEWSYRLYKEPWRWRRMLSLPKFFWKSLWA